ncbi:hypothetical protein Tco_1567170, partial [Tanacetum coccineum]
TMATKSSDGTNTLPLLDKDSTDLGDLPSSVTLVGGRAGSTESSSSVLGFGSGPRSGSTSR